MLTKKEELKDRVEARRHAMRARLSELKADTRHEAIEASQKIKRGLAELDDYLKDGWDKMSEGVHGKLSSWLDRSEREERDEREPKKP